MSQQRQLAAIMFTDIVGYTRLMGQSEEKALAVLVQNRGVQKPLIAQHNGRFIKELGDGTMASFDKASDAVRCAIEIQKASKEFPDLNLRIGIHLGEVVFENDDVFGDGVNIAARIESAGKAGAVYISGAVHGTVHNRDDIETRFVEQMQLKNVSRPIEIHEVAVDGVFSAATPKAPGPRTPFSKRQRLLFGAVATLLLLAGAYSIWGKKVMGGDAQLEHASIAVLPFTNMSSDAENEFFCDGVTEDILTHLSKLKNLKVISRTSVMHFKGSELTIPEIAAQLGVDYILEGSVRRQGDLVAITAQLIHAADDGHLWAENYERSLENVFAIQREVAQEIARVLNIKISLAERQGLTRSATEDVEAYQLYMKGRESGNDRTDSGLRRGIALLQQAIDRDPLYVDAMAQQVYFIQMLCQYGYAPRDSCIQAGQALVDAAFGIDTLNALAHVAKAEVIYQRILGGEKLWTTFRSTAQRAADLGPNSAEAQFMYGRALSDISAEESLNAFRVAESLDPYHNRIKINLTYALIQLQRYQEALDYMAANDALITLEDVKLQQKITCHYALRNWSEALRTEEIYVKTFPNDLNARSTLANHIYCLIGDVPRAFELLEQVRVKDARAVAPFNYLLWSTRIGAPEKAWEFLNSDQYLSGRTQAQIADDQAWLEILSGHPRKAITTLEQQGSYGITHVYAQALDGRVAGVRSHLVQDSTLSAYDKSCLYSLLGEIDSAFLYFDLEKGWEDIGWSRSDLDLKPLWNDARYQAKVASYNFPPLVPKN